MGSVIDRRKDTVRAPTVDPTLAFSGNAPGRIASLTGQAGTRWMQKVSGGPEWIFSDLMKSASASTMICTRWRIRCPIPATGKAAVVKVFFQIRPAKPRLKVTGFRTPVISMTNKTFTVGGRLESWQAYDGVNTTTVIVDGVSSLKTVNQTDKSAVGLTSYLVADLVARYRITKQITAIGGIDNVNDDKYWLFHPFPQRTYVAQLWFNY